jgi:hypothetical protein
MVFFLVCAAALEPREVVGGGALLILIENLLWCLEWVLEHPRKHLHDLILCRWLVGDTTPSSTGHGRARYGE